MSTNVRDLVWIGLALSLIGAIGASCSSERLGAAGASCTKTSDCEEPLACVDQTCVGGGQTSSASGAGGSGSSTTTGSGGTEEQGGFAPWSECDTCLDAACSAELAGCDASCVAVEACLEVLCKHLGEIGSSEEGECQARCQDDYPSGKIPHLAVVDCAVNAACTPPCAFYPQDYDACRVYMDGARCKDERSACDASVTCSSYRDCVSFCTTLKDCVACDDTPEGFEGRAILDTYETCIAAECIVTSWIP